MVGKEIGIDLGTTNTVVSYVDKKDRLQTLRFDGNTTLPSVLYFKTDREFEIGEKAKRMGHLNPQARVADFKSSLDKGKLEIVPEHGPMFRYPAKKVASNFLNCIITAIEKRLVKEFGPEKGVIGSVVITVPAKFNDVEKSAVKWAAQDAGFEDVRLAAEPTAAAVAHKLDSGLGGRTILVYDFGGGTFDVSVIQDDNGKFIELATGGDKRLGGNLLRDRLAKYLFKLVEDEYGIELPFDTEEFDEDLHGISTTAYMRNRAAIMEAADSLKEELSWEQEAEDQINIICPYDKPVVFPITITRSKFESLIAADLERTVSIARAVADEALDRGAESIERVVLAGGSANIPKVRELMQDAFENTIYADDVSTLVARGAALLASQAMPQTTEQISGVQYGVSTRNGVLYGQFSPVIMENMPLPCTGSAYFYLNKDGQDCLEIPYYERDIKQYPHASTISDDGVSMIDTLIIPDLPQGLRADEVRIKVDFTLQLDGTLEVRAEVQDINGTPIRNAEVVCKRRSNLE